MWHELLPPVRPEHRGVTADVARLFQEKKLSEKDYAIANASWVAQNLEQYPVRPIPQIPDALRIYVTKRQRGETRDETFHRQLGMWCQTMIRITQNNIASMNMIAWAAEKLDGALVKQAEDCRNKIQEFSNMDIGEKTFNEAIEVLKLDSSQKPRAS